MSTLTEEESLERADRLISEGVVGDRGLIASMIIEAVQHEREACATDVEALPWGRNEPRAQAIREAAAVIRKRT